MNERGNSNHQRHLWEKLGMLIYNKSFNTSRHSSAKTFHREFFFRREILWRQMTKILNVSLWNLGTASIFVPPIHVYRRAKLFAFASLPSICPPPQPPYFRFPYSAYHPSCLQQQTKSHPTTLKIEHKFDLYCSRNFSFTSESNVTFFREKRIRTLNSGRHIWVWNRLCSVLGPLGRWNVTPSVWGYGPYEKHIFQITTMRKENIQMKILRYALGAAAWKILRGGRVLLNDIFRHTLLLFLTHGSDIGYPFVVYQKNPTH